jgi:hypothetical protein
MSQAKALASLGVVDSKHNEPVSAWIWRARKVASTSDNTPSMSRSTIKVETDPTLADFFGTFLFPTMTLTLFFFFLSDWTTHALLLRQSLSHKTATVGAPTKSSEVVTQWLPWGMVIRRRERKGGGRVQLLWKKGWNEREHLWKRCSNRPQRGTRWKKGAPMLPPMDRGSNVWPGSTCEKKWQESDGKSRPVIRRQQVMRDVKEKREEKSKIPLCERSKVV